MYNTKKKIKDTNGIQEYNLNECIEQYSGLCHNHSVRCVNELGFLDACSFLDRDDYYNRSLMVLTKCWTNYNIQKSPVKFSNFLIIALENDKKSIIKNANAQKRFATNITSLDEKVTDDFSEGKDITLENIMPYTDGDLAESLIEQRAEVDFISTINNLLTKEDLLLLEANITKQNRELNKSVDYLYNIFQELTGKESISKKELCERFECTFPTIRSRTAKAENKLKEITSEYFKKKTR